VGRRSHARKRDARLRRGVRCGRSGVLREGLSGPDADYCGDECDQPLGDQLPIEASREGRRIARSLGRLAGSWHWSFRCCAHDVRYRPEADAEEEEQARQPAPSPRPTLSRPSPAIDPGCCSGPASLAQRNRQRHCRSRQEPVSRNRGKVTHCSQRTRTAALPNPSNGSGAFRSKRCPKPCRPKAKPFAASPTTSNWKENVAIA